eukprot:RCo032867
MPVCFFFSPANRFFPLFPLFPLFFAPSSFPPAPVCVFHSFSISSCDPPKQPLPGYIAVTVMGFRASLQVRAVWRIRKSASPHIFFPVPTSLVFGTAFLLSWGSCIARCL